MKNVLIVSGHPRLDDDSVANKAIAAAGREHAARVARLVEGL